ncbi:MAG: AAA family ATPase [Candidatus Zixiibacteriota bacterium]
MIPKRLYIKGFRSFIEPTEIDFTQIDMASITGPNGSGKSSLIEAILFALYNKLRTKNIKYAISHDMKSIHCELDFQNGDDIYRVIRKRSARSHKAELYSFDDNGFNRLPIDKIGDLDNHIVKLIGMPYDSFVKSSVLLQGEAGAFSELTPSDRMSFFSSILHLELFKDISEQAYARSKVLSGIIDNDQNQKDNLMENLEDLDEFKNEYAKDSEKLNELQEEIESFEAWLEEIIEKKIERNELLAEKKSLQKQYNDTKTNYTEKNSRKAKLRKKFDHLLQILEKASQIEDEFARYTDAQEKESKLTKIRDQIKDISDALQEKRHQIEKAKDSQKNRLEILESEQKSIRDRIDEYQEKLQKKDMVEKGLKKLENQREKLEILRQKQKNFYELEKQRQKLKSELEKKRALLSQKLTNLEGEKSQLEENIERLADADLWLSDMQETIEEKKDNEKRAQNISLAIVAKEEKIRNLKDSLKLKNQEIDEMNDKLELLRQKAKGECPLCGTELSKEHKENIEQKWKNNISDKEAEKLKIKRDITENEAKIERLQEKFNDVSEQIAKKEHIQEQISEYEDKIKERDRAKKRLDAIFPEIENLSDRIQKDEFEIELRNQLSSIENAMENIGFSEELLNKAMYRVENLSHFAADFENLKDIEKSIDKLAIDLAHKLDEKKSLEENIESGKDTIEIQNQIDGLIKKLEDIDYSEEEYKNSRKMLKELKNAPERMQKLRNARQQKESIESEIDALKEKLSDIEKKGKVLKINITKIDEILEETKDLDEIEKKAKVKLKSKSQMRDEIRDRLSILQSKIEEQKHFRDEINRLEESIKSRERENENALILKQLCNKHGVQKFLVSRMLPHIETESNHILSRLLPEIQVRFSTDSNYGLELIIQRADDENPYESLSGGERFRVDFSLRIALSRLIAMRYGQKVSTLIIDEGFGTQDKDGLSRMVDALLDISSEFEKIFVITHLEELKSEFPSNISLTKSGDSGSVAEVVHG